MRLKSLYIGRYKNLADFDLNFDGVSFIDVFVGKNGSGKSNLFEALIEIFRHLYDFDKDKGDPGFNYAIAYELSDKVTMIEWKEGEFTINGRRRRAVGQAVLPDNVLIYYSGHNDTVRELVALYEAAFRKRIKKADLDESRRFIGIGPDYKALLLSVLLMQRADNIARQFIFEKLGVKTIASEVKLVLRRPGYASDSRFDIEDLQADRYWRPEGITKAFLDRLSNCISPATGSQVRSEGYFASEDYYVLYFDIARIQQEFADLSAQELFRQFDNLKTLGTLTDISIPLTLTGGVDATTAQFSDGQFQSVYIYSIIELFKDRNCLTLLDEPDSFLHPEWQFDFLKQVFEITDTTAKSNHVLMSSHSASTITTAQDSFINLFELEGNKVVVRKVAKNEVIRSLSGGFISFTESEARLSISQMLKGTAGAVLFTEGVTDEMILETAWSKLNPTQKRCFVVQNAFDRIFLRNLFSRDELRVNFPNRTMFALFDFDEAYDDWNGLKTHHHLETDPCKGLSKQLVYNSHYAMLLPVPNDEELKRQVLDPTGQPWGRGSDSHLTIELLFYREHLLGKGFQKKAASGGGEIIEFVGDKVKFAKEFVPTLDVASFDVFRPMFAFIQSTSKASSVT